jgi:hypothetical protein
VEFFHKNEYVRSYSIYKHDTTLKMTFGANFFFLILIQHPLVSAPIGMQSYKAVDFMSESLGTILFTNHGLIPISPEPCFEGTRVAAYEKAIQIRPHIISFQHSLCRGYEINHDHEVLSQFKAYTRQPTVRGFLRDVVKFQRDAVLDWNKYPDDVTLSYNMGFVGVREDSSDGAAAMILDMLLKFGVLVYNQDEMWALH